MNDKIVINKTQVIKILGLFDDACVYLKNKNQHLLDRIKYQVRFLKENLTKEISVTKKQALLIIELLEDADYNIKNIDEELSGKLVDKISFLRNKVNGK